MRRWHWSLNSHPISIQFVYSHSINGPFCATVPSHLRPWSHLSILIIPVKRLTPPRPSHLWEHQAVRNHDQLLAPFLSCVNLWYTLLSVFWIVLWTSSHSFALSSPTSYHILLFNRVHRGQPPPESDPFFGPSAAEAAAAEKAIP